MKQLAVEQMIDWYDGIVQAVVVAEWLVGAHLCSLLAIDHESGRRVFALLPLSAEETARAATMSSLDWNSWCSWLRETWLQAAVGEVTACLMDRSGVIASERRVDIARVREEAESDIEAAAQVSRAHWFQEFGA